MMHSTPPFAPQLIDEPGAGLVYQDGVVFGAVDVTPLATGGKALAIYEWSSHDPGKGHSERALRWLREQGCVTIEAYGVGTLDLVDAQLVGDISMGYWAHMVRKGLIDTIYDDEGRELDVVADGVRLKAPKAPRP